MSISSNIRKAGPFAGNGAQVTFAFAFKVFTTADVLVTKAVAGVETILALSTDYTVALNADQDNAPGGSITCLVAPAVGATLVISSNVDSLQSVVVTNGGGFFPAVFNAVFDKLTILVQQNIEKLSRGLVLPITSNVTSSTVPVTPSGVLQWAADGSQLAAVTLPSLALQLALPSMAGKSSQFLTNDGISTASWAAAPVLSVAGLTGAVTAAQARIAEKQNIRNAFFNRRLA